MCNLLNGIFHVCAVDNNAYSYSLWTVLQRFTLWTLLRWNISDYCCKLQIFLDSAHSECLHSVCWFDCFIQYLPAHGKWCYCTSNSNYAWIHSKWSISGQLQCGWYGLLCLKSETVVKWLSKVKFVTKITIGTEKEKGLGEGSTLSIDDPTWYRILLQSEGQELCIYFSLHCYDI